MSTKKRKTPLERRLGRCYELSAQYVLDHPDTVLVHGSIQGNGHPRIGHAWVTWSEHVTLGDLDIEVATIHDPVTEMTMPAEAWLFLHNGIADDTYTIDELRELIVETRHWGPFTGRWKTWKGGTP